MSNKPNKPQAKKSLIFLWNFETFTRILALRDTDKHTNTHTMNNVPTTPKAVYTTYLNPVEALNVGGPKAQALWVEGETIVKAERAAEARMFAAMAAGAAFIIGTTIAAMIF